jgi:hypothetical protein
MNKTVLDGGFVHPETILYRRMERSALGQAASEFHRAIGQPALNW